MILFSLLFASLFTSEIIKPTEAATNICRTGNDDLQANGNITYAFGLMAFPYELNKVADTQDDPVMLMTTYNYTRLSGRNYERVKSICEATYGYDLCMVNTKTKHKDTVDGVPVIRDVMEVGKPVCFPKSCSYDQIHMLDPNPANCDPLTPTTVTALEPCEILYYEPSCPERIVTNTSTCEADAIPAGTPYSTRLNLLETTILGSCANALTGGETETCKVEYGTLKATTITDFSPDRDTYIEYIAYENMCILSGGEICNVDVSAKYIIQRGNLGQTELTDTYLQLPICFPTQCENEQDKEDIAIENFKILTSEALTIARTCDESCDVTIQSISCGSHEVENSEPRPSPSPVQIKSLNPSRVDNVITLSPIKQEQESKPPVLLLTTTSAATSTVLSMTIGVALFSIHILFLSLLLS